MSCVKATNTDDGGIMLLRDTMLSPRVLHHVGCPAGAFLTGICGILTLTNVMIEWNHYVE